MDAAHSQAGRSWFRSAAGIRFGVEIAAIVLAKIAALILLYLAFVVAQPRIDTSPAALRNHVAGDDVASGAAP